MFAICDKLHFLNLIPDAEMYFTFMAYHGEDSQNLLCRVHRSKWALDAVYNANMFSIIIMCYTK
jgi:hypothetical protein